MTFNDDSIGALVDEIRADAGVLAIVGANPTYARGRVRGFEAAPKTDSYDGDAQGPARYRAFVIVRGEGRQRLRRAPVQRPRAVAKCFGRTKEEASQLASAVSAAVHDRGPRIRPNGLGIYRSFADSDGGQDQDPDTQQPFVDVFIDLVATTMEVAS